MGVVVVVYLLASLVREAFRWRAALAYPPSKSFAAGRAAILREFDRAISFGGLSPLRSGQQSSCACDCRNGNGDDEKLERSDERTTFELVDSRKQRESDEADGEYVERAAHISDVPSQTAGASPLRLA